MAPVRSQSRVLRPLQDFLATEAAGGAVLGGFVVVALLWVNLWPGSYGDLWSTETVMSIGDHRIALDLHDVVNDVLMTAFFFVIGLEVKRQVTEGELRDPRKVALPLIAALGGMIVPALLFAVVNPPGSDGAGGWGVPMATDVAVALGVLALLGSRVPPGLKAFLLTLAIADDIGAVAVIALFYGGSLDLSSLLFGLGLIAVAAGLVRSGVRWMTVYVVLAVGAWLAFHRGGVHPTLVGVAFGLLAPTRPVLDYRQVEAVDLADVSTVEAARETATTARNAVSMVDWLEHRLHPWSSFVVLPLFALANAGVELRGEAVPQALGSPVTWGVVLGLVVGKALGVSLSSLLAIRLRLGRLPQGVDGRRLLGLACLAGVGFTVSIFVTELAFADPQSISDAKIGTLLASLVASVVGAAILARR